MRLAVNAIYSMSSVALPMVVSIVTVPLYLHAIGGDRYGALMIAWLLLGYFGQADFGISRAITQRISALKREAGLNAETLWSGIVGVIAFSIFSAVLVYVASGYFFSGPFKVDETLRAEMMDSRWALSLCIPIIAITSVFSGALMGVEKFKLVSMGNMASSLAMQVIPLLIAHLIGTSMPLLIGAALGGRAIGLLIVGAGAWWAMLRRQSIKGSVEEFRHLFTFGAWIMLTMIVGPMMTMADRFVIGGTLGATAVVIYAVPFQIANRSALFPFAISQVLFPRFASDFGDRSLERCRSATSLIAQIYAPMVIGLACLAAPLLKLWIGSKLDIQSILIGQIVLLGFWTNAVAGVPYAYIQARGNPRFTALLHVAELPLYVGALYGLGMKFGLAGVAAAFSLRCALDAVLLAWAAKVWDRELCHRLAGPAVLVTLSIAAGQFFQTWGPAILSAAVLCSLSCVVTLVQMPQEIRAQLDRTPLARFLPRGRAGVA